MSKTCIVVDYFDKDGKRAGESRHLSMKDANDFLDSTSFEPERSLVSVRSEIASPRKLSLISSSKNGIFFIVLGKD